MVFVSFPKKFWLKPSLSSDKVGIYAFLISLEINNRGGGASYEIAVTVDPNINNHRIIKYAEDLGFDGAWVPDSQMIWSDLCHLALAATNTSKIEIGIGVSIPGTRIAPVTAHSIGTINQLAPGRTFLGIGTGHTAMRVMGQNPMPVKEFREYLRVVRVP